MAHEDFYSLIPETCKYAGLHRKEELRPNVITRVLMSERGKQKSQCQSDKT